jgi:hypothetical protein
MTGCGNEETTMSDPRLCGRAGLARILDVSEGTARNVELAGEIAPEMVVGGRPLFSVEKALALAAKRHAERAAGRARRAPANAAA